MGLLNRLFGKKTKSEAAPSTAIINERKSKIQAILDSLILQKIIDSKETASHISEILIDMGDPKLEQDAIKIIAGIMNQFANDERRELFLSLSEALAAVYGYDDASKFAKAIVEEQSRIVDTKD